MAAYRRLPLPDQVQWLRRHGHYLATRQEGGIRQHLFALSVFFVETWHWSISDARPGANPRAALAAVDLINSFQQLPALDVWLAGLPD